MKGPERVLRFTHRKWIKMIFCCVPSYRIIIKKLEERGILHYMPHCYRIFSAIAIPKCSRLCIYYLDLMRFREKENRRRDVRIEIAQSLEDISSFIKERDDWYYDYSKSLFERGNLCFVAKIRNRIVSCLWTSFGEVYLSDVKYTLPVDKEIVPLIDAYTLPEFRGLGIYAILWNWCVGYFRRISKYTAIYGFIVPSNKRSISVHKRLGLKGPIMEIILLRMFGISKHIIRHFGNDRTDL